MGETRTQSPSGDRLAKVMARAGLCSRRQAEEWITAGRVEVNGKPVRTPAFNVTENDNVTVDGEPLAAKRGTRLWLYHKPAGTVVTESDPEGRPTIFTDLRAKGLPRVMSVGRLDINTEGLLLLTNDGGLKRVLELPETGWLRRYRVRAHGTIEQSALDKLKDGMTVEGVNYGPIEATIERVQGANVWINVALREGKNREIKNVLGALGLNVNRLIRVSFGPFQLGELPVGAVDTVKAKMLRDQLGKKLATRAGADFDAPMPEPLVAAAPAAKPARNQERARPLDGEQRGPRSRRDDDRGRPGRDDRPARPRRDDDRPNARRDDRPARPRRDDDRPNTRRDDGPSRPRRDDDRGRPNRDDSRGRPARDEGRGRPRRDDDRSRGRRDDRDDRPANTRRILFDDGREPETFEPRPERPGKDRRDGKPGGDRKGKGGPKSFGDRKSGGDRKPDGERRPRDQRSGDNGPRGNRRPSDKGRSGDRSR